VTGDELALAYLSKATARRRVLDVLLEEAAYSDVVREAQELVELALKGVLRLVGIDPPKWHDVGPLLVEHETAFPAWFADQGPDLARISRWLRKEREQAFYGDIDLIPTTSYTVTDAQRACQDARTVLEAFQRLVDEREQG
jgi:HEPN domain-containing protein